MNTNIEGKQEREHLMEVEYINGVPVVNGKISFDGGETITR